ncbi:MAG: hypothetical protein KJ804_19805 [Proteobacteria bacterium]|nr:hypothetical protein [Pseudomonadota bacterium]
MHVSQLFSYWREIKKPERSWGLAWYLAYEFCRRYYASHGIVPLVITHEGLGYYGIQLDSLSCHVNDKNPVTYGRMTIGGDVENWRTGGPGDHGLPAIEMCSRNVPTEEIVQQAIAHMEIEPIPNVSHLNCRHKRWGGAYELCFEIATILALRNDHHELAIWNHSYHTERILRELDPKANMKEHPGAFLFERGDKKLLLAADGRLLDRPGSDKNMWHYYINGHSAFYLADLIEKLIDI